MSVHDHFCATCNRFRLGDHRCLPEWRGWVDGHGDEDNPDVVRAGDAEDAAEALVQGVIDAYAGEVSAAQRFEVFVFIEGEEEDGMPKVKKFNVFGEYEITWHVREAT